MFKYLSKYCVDFIFLLIYSTSQKSSDINSDRQWMQVKTAELTGNTFIDAHIFYYKVQTWKSEFFLEVFEIHLKKTKK